MAHIKIYSVETSNIRRGLARVEYYLARINKFNTRHQIGIYQTQKKYQPFNDQCSHRIETSQLICTASQLTGFYMMRTLIVKGLIKNVNHKY